MKKLHILAIAFLLCTTAVQAQSKLTTVQYNKVMQPALVLEIPNSTKDVEGTILEKLKQTGYDPETQGHLFWKKNKTDGFYVFNNIKLPTLSTQKLDMYFKVVQKNRTEKNTSILYLMVSAGNENFVSPTTDEILWNSSASFLNSFIERTTAYSLEQNITSQEDAIKESQNKLAKLQKDEKDMNEKIKNYQEDIIKNQNNQKDQQLNIEAQVKQLEVLRLERKG